MKSPKCTVCGASTYTEFNMSPRVPDKKFGEICVPCEEVYLSKEDA